MDTLTLQGGGGGSNEIVRFESGWGRWVKKGPKVESPDICLVPNIFFKEVGDFKPLTRFEYFQ